MSVTLWTGDDEAVGLGPTVEFFEAVSGLRKIDDADSWQPLYNCGLAGDDTLDPEYVSRIADLARGFVRLYGHHLDDHQRWILDQIAGLNAATDQE